MGGFVTCYISSGDEAEHHEDPQEHGADGGPDALSPPTPGTATSPGARATSLPSPGSQAAPSAAHATSLLLLLLLLLPPQHMIHSQVKPL